MICSGLENLVGARLFPARAESGVGRGHTYIATDEAGCICIVLDFFNREIVGWR